MQKTNLEKAMEEMECWQVQKHLKSCKKCSSSLLQDIELQAQKHLKSCKKCSSSLLQDIEKKIEKLKIECIATLFPNSKLERKQDLIDRQKVLQILKEKKYEERTNI